MNENNAESIEKTPEEKIKVVFVCGNYIDMSENYMVSRDFLCNNILLLIETI